MFTVYHFDYTKLEKLSKKLKTTKDYYVFKSLPIEFNIAKELQENFGSNLDKQLSVTSLNSPETKDIIKEYLETLIKIDAVPDMDNAYFAIEHNLYEKVAVIKTEDLAQAAQAIYGHFPKENNKLEIISHKENLRQTRLGDLIYDEEKDALYLLNNVGLTVLENKYHDFL